MDRTGYVKEKWWKELNIEISREDWCSMWKAQHSSTSSKKWRECSWRNSICYFITLHIKSKPIQSEEQWRRLCGNTNAHHSLVFWLCPNIQIFWGKICLTKILGYEVTNNVKVLYFCILRIQICVCAKYCWWPVRKQSLRTGTNRTLQTSNNGWTLWNRSMQWKKWLFA